MNAPATRRTALLSLAIAATLASIPAHATPRTTVYDVPLEQALETQAGPYKVVAIFDVPTLGDVERTTPEGRVAIARVREAIVADHSIASKNIRRTFASVTAIALTLDVASLAKLSEDPRITAIGLDIDGRGGLAESHLITRALDLHADGILGNGVTVAVLDSGLDFGHEDVNDDVIDEACFCAPNCCPDGSSTQTGTGSAQDDHGHGTHVSGIIGSGGNSSPLGTSPDVTLFPIKVLDSQNAFQSLSDIVAGLDHLVTSDVPVDVVNMSLGTSAGYSNTCDNFGGANQAMAQAVANLNAAGTILFASTGNEVRDFQIASPSCLTGVVGVVATYDVVHNNGFNFGNCNDTAADPSVVTCFSNVSSDAAIAAPGHNIRASRRGGGSVNFYGTSMASPQAAGCAALLKSVDPSLTPNEILSAMLAAPVTATDATTNLSFPRLDCAHAYATLGLDEEPDAGVGVVDAGQPIEDAGAPVDDAGQPNEDAGVGDEDAGVGGEDAGVGDEDAGQPIEDAGQPIEDAGVGDEDAGQPIEDAGAPLDDAGQPIDDAGVPQEPDPAPGAEPSPSPAAEPGAEPSAEPSAEPEGTPEATLLPGECSCEASSTPDAPALAIALLVGLAASVRRRRKESAPQHPR